MIYLNEHQVPRFELHDSDSAPRDGTLANVPLFMDANNYNIRIHCDLSDLTLGVNWTVLTDRITINQEAKEIIDNYIKGEKFSPEVILQGFKDYWQFVKDVLITAKSK